MNRRYVATVVAAGAVCLGMTLPVAPVSASSAAPSAPTPLQLQEPEPWMELGDADPGAYTATSQPVVVAKDTGATSPEARGPVPQEAPDTRVAHVVADSAWSWFMDPRVLGTDRATYLSSVRNNGDIQVTSIDRTTARMRHKILAARSQPDDHNAPSLIEAPDGRIAAFWNHHGSIPPRYRVTKTSGNVTTFGPEQRLVGSGLESEAVTYTSVMYLRGNRNPYHFFTRRQSDRAWVMTTSRDLKTWTPAVRLFAHPNPDSRPYPKFVTTGWNTIHMAVSDTTSTAGQPSSMYHMYLQNGVFRQSDGTSIRSLSEVAGSAGRAPRPINPREATLVYDGRSADGRARVYDISMAGTVPTIVLTTGESGGRAYTYKWFQRQSANWTMKNLERTVRSPNGITMRHDDPGRVFLASEVKNSINHTLEEYSTGDRGVSWLRRRVSGEGADQRKAPAAPWSSQDGPITVAWMRGPYTKWYSGQWSTNVTIETSDPAPIELSTTWSSTWANGAGVPGRVTAGVRGPGVSGAKVWLLVRKPGQAERWMHSTHTRADGTFRLPVNRYYPSGTRVRAYSPATADWGQDTSGVHSTAATPINVATTWSSTWAKGAGVPGRVTTKVGGSGVSGAKVWLLVRKPGQAERWMHSTRTRGDGSFRLSVNRYYPKGTRVRVHVPATGSWGKATSGVRYT